MRLMLSFVIDVGMICIYSLKNNRLKNGYFYQLKNQIIPYKILP